MNDFLLNLLRAVPKPVAQQVGEVIVDQVADFVFSAIDRVYNELKGGDTGGKPENHTALPKR